MALDPKDVVVTVFSRYGHEPAYEVRMVHAPTGKFVRLTGGALVETKEQCLERLEALVKE